MKIISVYFKFIFPVLILLLLGREFAVLRATPNENVMQNVSFFVPELIKNDAENAEFAEWLSPYVANRRLTHLRYKACLNELRNYLVFNRNKEAGQREECLRILNDGLAVAPSSPLIWLEKAKQYAALGETELLNMSLTNARIVAKKQSWVVKRRIDFSLQNWDDLSDANKQAAEFDFLFMSPEDKDLVQSVATLYLLQPDAKEVIEVWLEKSDVKVQKRFVKYLKASS